MYESEQSVTTAALNNANPTVFTQSTIDQILRLATRDNATVRFDEVRPDASGNVTVAAGAEVVIVSSSDTVSTTIIPPANAPVVIFQGRGGVVATLNDGVTTPSSNQSQVDRVVVGSSGNDRLVVSDTKNTKIILGSGNNTVNAGGGVDTIEAGLGNSTITGGSGDYAVVKLAGNASNYQVTVNNGVAKVTNTTTNKTTDITKIQFVQLDNGNALVFANNSVEGQVANLYRTTFGRDADAGGLDYWFDLVKGGATLAQVSNAFVSSNEFTTSRPANETNTEFVQSLYKNVFNRAGEETGVAFWVNSLAQGQTKAQIVAQFANIALQNQTNTAPNQETQVVGSVTLVTGII